MAARRVVRIGLAGAEFGHGRLDRLSDYPQVKGTGQYVEHGLVEHGLVEHGLTDLQSVPAGVDAALSHWNTLSDSEARP
jgi:hypothetical protein